MSITFGQHSFLMACVAVADRGPVALELRWVRIPEPRNHRSFECLLSIFGGTARSLTSELMIFPYFRVAMAMVAMPRSRCSSVTLMALRSSYGLQPVWGEIRLVLMWWHHWKSLKKTNRHCRCSLPGWWFDLDDPDRLIVGLVLEAPSNL